MDDATFEEETEETYVTDMWSSHLNRKDGITFDLHKVETHIHKNEVKKIGDLKLGSTCIRGIVPEEFLPKKGKEFRIYHYMVDGTLNYGVINVQECDISFEENGSFLFSSVESDEKFVIVPTEKSAN
jgi:GR25 family glycosyltransferase involved in LPS biosynthesis